MRTLKLITVSTMNGYIILFLSVFVISLTGCTKSPAENPTIIPNDKARDTDLTVSAVTVNVKTVGAVGNGTTDDTWAFNAAIDQVVAGGGGTVYVPVGTYLINPDVSIIMKSNVILDMVDSTRILKVKPSSLKRYNVIRMHKISNATVKAGKILGERYQHIVLDPTDKGEHGMGISIYGSTNCRVTNTVILNCWGDGITIGSQATEYNAPNQSVRCVISGVQCRSNRRQGLTIGGVDSLIVVNSKFLRTYGTAPQAGIDIEPDANTATRVHIKNCEIAYNEGNGVEMYAKPTTTAVITGITVQGNVIHHNAYSGYLIRVSNVNFNYNNLKDHTYMASVPYVTSTSTNVDITPNTY